MSAAQNGDRPIRAVRDLLLAYEHYDAAWRRRFALNANEKLVVLLIAEGVTTTPTELSRAINMTTAGMTNLLDRLAEEGFVRRERHATDRRRVLLTLTKRGLQASLEFESVNQDIADELDPDARESIETFLATAARTFVTRTAELNAKIEE